MAEKPIGKVIHFFDKINVAVIRLDEPLSVGDKIKIGKEDNFFEQEVESMQVNHKEIEIAETGQEVGMKVKEKVRENDLVFKME